MALGFCSEGLFPPCPPCPALVPWLNCPVPPPVGAVSCQLGIVSETLQPFYIDEDKCNSFTMAIYLSDPSPIIENAYHRLTH